MQLQYKKLWEEFQKDAQKIDLSSLKIKNTLNSSFWSENNDFDLYIRERLLEIAQEFFENLGLEGVEIEDITLTGSLASYNWSEYSDIDLHIVIDFKKVDENFDLVREYFNGKTFIWNNKHKIEILGYEVEIYVQDPSETHHSLGIFSLLSNEWVSEPTKTDKKIDFEGTKKKAIQAIDCIERVFDLFEDKKYKKTLECGKNIKEKIKNMRKTGLETTGVFSIENLTFKILRRMDYLGDLNEIIDKSYDRIHSLAKKFTKKLKIYVSEPEKNEKPGFFALNELEKYQKKLKRRHKRQKKRLIGLGKQKNKPPYSHKPAYKRAKSAPSGAGGA